MLFQIIATFIAIIIAMVAGGYLILGVMRYIKGDRGDAYKQRLYQKKQALKRKMDVVKDLGDEIEVTKKLKEFGNQMKKLDKQLEKLNGK